jgi:hypothetical protein
VLHFIGFHTIVPTDLLHPSPAPHSKTLRVFLLSFLKVLSLITTLTCYKYITLLVSFLNLSPVIMLQLVLITAMKYEMDRMQTCVTRFQCLLSPVKGGASSSLLSHLAVLLHSRLSLSFFAIDLVKAVLITRTFLSPNAIVTQSKNCPFGISNTIGPKIYKNYLRQ